MGDGSTRAMTLLVRPLAEPGPLVSASESTQLRSGYVVLAPGTHVGEHSTAGGEEAILVLKGTAEVTSPGGTASAEAPAEVIVPAHTLHDVWNHTSASLEYVYVVVADRP